jgi:hypothetical protein
MYSAQRLMPLGPQWQNQPVETTALARRSRLLPFVTQGANSYHAGLPKWPPLRFPKEAESWHLTGRTCLMISVTQCAVFAGLASGELILGVALSDKHRWLLSGYLSNMERGPAAVRDMIVADMRRFHELGALRRAADLLLVLRLFLTHHPDARFGQKPNPVWRKRDENAACNAFGGRRRMQRSGIARTASASRLPCRAGRLSLGHERKP